MPFPVLLDEDGEAARIAGTRRLQVTTILKPAQIVAGARSTLGGHRQHRSGRRPYQLGATLVVAPGDRLAYADYEDYAGDHADIDEVIAAAQAAAG